MQLIMCFYVFRHGYLGSGPHTRIKCLLHQGHISINLWCLQSYRSEGIAHMVRSRQWGSHLIQGDWHLVRYIASLYIVSFIKLFYIKRGFSIYTIICTLKKTPLMINNIQNNYIFKLHVCHLLFVTSTPWIEMLCMHAMRAVLSMHWRVGHTMRSVPWM